MRGAILVSLVLAATARADDATPTSGATTPSAHGAWGAAGTFLPLKPVRFALGIGSGIGWLREHTSQQQSISGSGPTFHMMVGFVIKDIVTLSAAGGALFPTDDKSFTEVVMPVGGGPSRTASSNLQVARYSIAIGLRTPFLVLSASERIAGAVFMDYGVSRVAAQRTVMDCIDCRYEDIELPGGRFSRVGVDLGSPGAWRRSGGAVTLAYQRYWGDSGISQELQLGLTLWIP